MQTALKIQTTILPGHRIEVAAPDIPEGVCVEMLIYPLSEMTSLRPVMDSPLAHSPASGETLKAEYKVLIETQWQRALTASEQSQLEAIKAEMDALDAASDTNRLWNRQIEDIHCQLATIRQMVETLPNAS